jgi:hypothetical protein
MARTQRLIRLGTALAFLCLLFADGQAHAENTGGITATYYIITETPPSKDLTQHILCGSETENNINRSFDGEPFTPCPDDLFMVHYTGFITLPAHSTIQFWLASDDGGTMKIGTHEWGDWSDKGCTAIETEPMTMEAEQPLMLDGWFYENGGGTCFMLAWRINNGDWEIVPDSAFTVSAPATTTTTEATTTTDAPTTTQEPSTTTIQTQTTHHQVQTTVAEPVVTVPATTTTAALPSTLPSSVPVSTVPAPSPTDALTTTLPMPTTTLPLQEPTSEPQSETDTQIIELIDNLDTATVTEIIEAVATILDAGIDAEQAAELATNPELLETIEPEQAQEIFEALDIEALDPSEITALVEAVQDAPTEVREAFEEAVNVFDGAVDSYVPIGSTVPISTRRLVIAAGALLSAVPVSSRQKW